MSRPVRALHLCAGNLYGGVERIVVECARSRAQCPAMVPLFGVCFDGRLSEEIEGAGSECRRLGPVRFSRPLTLWRARRALARILAADAPDAVICHSAWMFAIAAPIVRGRSSQLILWLHDRVSGRPWTERWAGMTRPDLVVSNSRFTAESVPRMFSGVRSDVLYAPVADGASLTAGDRTSLRASLGAAGADVVLLMASRFEEWKGHRMLLSAVSHLTGSWRLWIAGAAQRAHERAYVTELQRLSAASGIADRVSFLGERRDVPALMRAADIHCQPNIGPEPFGLAFVEALYAGRPVVTTDMGGAREIVTADCGILVPPGDDAALASALDRLVRDGALRDHLGSSGPARARALCDPRAQLQALRRLVTAA
jgi:glycosyltransferase involved in cell wall biosynthesis